LNDRTESADMDSARIALGSLAATGAGILLGLAANPTMRSLPGTDWRERYRPAAAAPEFQPQAGVSYFGDGSTAWLYGGVPARLSDRTPPLQPPAAIPEYDYRPEPYDATPVESAADGDAPGAAERAAAQAAVAAALVRSAPTTSQEHAVEERGSEIDAGPATASAAATTPPVATLAEGGAT
jgi:hypothetical protein